MDERERARGLLNKLGMSPRRQGIYAEGIARANEEALKQASDGVEAALEAAPAALAKARQILADQRDRAKRTHERRVPSRRHTILFLTADPVGVDRIALDTEARAIARELERSHRERFSFESRWAVEPLELLRELRRIKPAVVHFSGHGEREGLLFQAADGGTHVVSGEALADAFAAAGASVKLVVLNACYTEAQAEALLRHVPCVVGTRGQIRDETARSFAIGFYEGLGERASVRAAYEQACAAILERPFERELHHPALMSAEMEGYDDRPRLIARNGVDVNSFVLVDVG